MTEYKVVFDYTGYAVVYVNADTAEGARYRAEELFDPSMLNCHSLDHHSTERTDGEVDEDDDE